MKRYACKGWKFVCTVALALAFVAGVCVVPAHAATHGIYTATATPHYRHPQTGVIEDSGGEDSEVLGQSMTESATDTAALVEVDAKGNTFVTIRLKLMDNIQDPTFQVDGTAVEASVTQEDSVNNTADYRMQVTDENSVIRCEMYVIPMGRSVIFYITVSDLQEGSGDFITNITVDPAAANVSNGAEEQTAETSTEAADAQAEADAADSVKDSSGEVEGIAEFDVDDEGSAEPETTETASQSMPVAPIIGIVVVIVAVAVICVAVSRSGKKKDSGDGKKNENDEKDENDKEE